MIVVMYLPIWFMAASLVVDYGAKEQSLRPFY